MNKKPGDGESAYSGRWVARVQGRIVGQGGTPEAASRAARANRHKELAEVTYTPQTWPTSLSQLIQRIVAAVPNGEMYLVGGAVRDALLGRTSHDLDFAVAGDATAVARKLAGALGADFYVLDHEFGAARLILTAEDGTRDRLDFSNMRGGSIQSDLVGRDFSINAIALNVRDWSTLDPVQGAADLSARVIRACSPMALSDDPIRILRAVRLAAALDFRIEAETRVGMRSAANLLGSISAERKRDELFRMLGGPRPAACMQALELLGVFRFFLPELGAMRGIEQPSPHVHDAWAHTLSVMRHLDEILRLILEGEAEGANGLEASLLMLAIGRYRDSISRCFAADLNPERSLRALLQYAALYHDVAKPTSGSRSEDGRIHFLGHEKSGASLAADQARALNLSKAEIEWIHTVILNHLRFFFLASRKETEGETPKRRAIYRFFRAGGAASVPLIMLGLADLRGTREHLLTEAAWSDWLGVARGLMENLWDKPEETVAPMRLVNGHVLMDELSLRPGPLLGELLEAIREAQAAGEIRDRDGALALARDWMSAHEGGPAE